MKQPDWLMICWGTLDYDFLFSTDKCQKSHLCRRLFKNNNKKEEMKEQKDDEEEE